MLSIIVAFDQRRGIGKQGWMPWSLPQDLRLFKQRTAGHALIMGATTFLGLPRPLAGRHTYVINEVPLQQHDDVTYIIDLPAFLAEQRLSSEEVFVCGGASIYKQALPFCEKMYISHVHGIYPADTYFPEFDYDDWVVVNSEEYEGFTVKEYVRR